MEAKNVRVLTEEEWELIGEYRHKKDHGKNQMKITIICFVAALLIAGAIFITTKSNYYIIGLIPACIPMFYTAKLNNDAEKAGHKLATEVLSKM